MKNYNGSINIINVRGSFQMKTDLNYDLVKDISTKCQADSGQARFYPLSGFVIYPWSTQSFTYK